MSTHAIPPPPPDLPIPTGHLPPAGPGRTPGKPRPIAATHRPKAPAPAAGAWPFLYGCMLPTFATGLAYLVLFALLPFDSHQDNSFTEYLVVGAAVLVVSAGLALGRRFWGWSMQLAGVAVGLLSAPVVGIGLVGGFCVGGGFAGPLGAFLGGALGALAAAAGVGAVAYLIIRVIQRWQTPAPRPQHTHRGPRA